MTLSTPTPLPIGYRPNAYDAVEAEVLTALENGAEPVVLDFQALRGLDTNGVRGLIALLRRTRAAGGKLALTSVNSDIRRTLQVTALDRIFPILDGEAA